MGDFVFNRNNYHQSKAKFKQYAQSILERVGESYKSGHTITLDERHQLIEELTDAWSATFNDYHKRVWPPQWAMDQLYKALNIEFEKNKKKNKRNEKNAYLTDRQGKSRDLVEVIFSPDDIDNPLLAEDGESMDNSSQLKIRQSYRRRSALFESTYNVPDVNLIDTYDYETIEDLLRHHDILNQRARWRSDRLILHILIDLHMAISKLTEKQRACVELYYYHGYTYEEIVHQCGFGTSPQNIEQTIEKAIKKIVKVLER